MSNPLSIELIAPSGYPDQEAVRRAVERFQHEGHHVGGIASTRRQFERFAGTDSERASDINGLADPSRTLPNIVIAARGGYGTARLLHGLDYDGLRARLEGHSLAMVGHSDFTGLQMALLAKAGLITFGGPMLADFGAETPSSFTTSHFWRAMRSTELVVGGLRPIHGEVAPGGLQGTLWGGNLSMIASLVGTPYLPQIDGGILFIEDVNERPFRIERMLYQLHLSGILGRQQALVLGHFTNAGPLENNYSVHTAIQQIHSVSGIPVLAGLAFGHVSDLLTLPVGAHAQLQSDGRAELTMTVSGYPNFA